MAIGRATAVLLIVVDATPVCLTEGRAPPAVLRGQGPSVRPSLEGSALVPAPPPLVPRASPTSSWSSGGSRNCIFRDFGGFSRVGFLTLALRRHLSGPVVEDLTIGLRNSTLQLYQSYWSAFQGFVKSRVFTSISQDVVLRCFCFLFHVKGHTMATIFSHAAALKDPLWYGFRFALDAR